MLPCHIPVLVFNFHDRWLLLNHRLKQTGFVKSSFGYNHETALQPIQKRQGELISIHMCTERVEKMAWERNGAQYCSCTALGSVVHPVYVTNVILSEQIKHQGKRVIVCLPTVMNSHETAERRSVNRKIGVGKEREGIWESNSLLIACVDPGWDPGYDVKPRLTLTHC